ncbi:MAG: hypothetical protein J6C64_09625 [Lachnospiraceae bacterium]|nr:hypothetical protein [Lachnospiraceae bacterium]
MMYMHYCKCCQRVFMLNGHKMICPKCTEPLTELRISYLDYVNLDMQGREELINACADEEQLNKMKATYRMYKYSKWYRELQAQNENNLPITTLLASLAVHNTCDSVLQTGSPVRI